MARNAAAKNRPAPSASDERRLYPESKLPMTEKEREAFLEAAYENAKKNRHRSDDDRRRLAGAAGERAVRRARGPQQSAEERTLDMFAAR